MGSSGKHRAWVTGIAAAMTGLVAASCATAPIDAEIAAAATEPPVPSQEEQIMERIAQLSIDDKLKLLTGQGYSLQSERMPDTDRYVPGAAGYTYAVEDEGLSSLVLADGPAGLRVAPVNPETGEPQYATAFSANSSTSVCAVSGFRQK